MIPIDKIDETVVEDALKAWKRGDIPENGILDLHICIGFGSTQTEKSDKLFEVLNDYVDNQINHFRKHLLDPPYEIKIENRTDLKQVIKENFAPQHIKLEAWTALYFQYFEPIYYVKVQDLAQYAEINMNLFRNRVSIGLKGIAHYLRQKEVDAQKHIVPNLLKHQLGPTKYYPLAGMETIKSQLLNELDVQDKNHYICIEGYGGIGKTTIAREVAEKIIHGSSFKDVIWLSADTSTVLSDMETPAIQTLEDVINRIVQYLSESQLESLSSIEQKINFIIPHLTQVKYLIVIDNLENIDDSELLINQIYGLAGPSRFLITSRDSLEKFEHVFSLTLKELSLEDSLDFLKYQLDIGPHKTISPTEMNEIYDCVGGNPLALKLVAAQLAHYRVEEALADIRLAKKEKIGRELYDRIYGKTWRVLSKNAKELMYRLLNVSVDGAHIDYLRKLSLDSSNISKQDFDDSVIELQNLSLIEYSGFDTRQLRLHRLTATYLQSKISDEPEL